MIHYSSEIYEALKCPLFKGYVITVSGIPVSHRLEIKELIEKEGKYY